MDGFHCQYFFPVWEADDKSPATAPDLAPYLATREVVRGAFRTHLLHQADASPAGQVFDVEGRADRVLLRLVPIHQTAAIVDIARFVEPPAPSIRMATAVLFSGLGDADAAVLDLAASLPLFVDFPHLLDSVRAGPRPLLLQCFPDRDAFADPIAHVFGIAAAAAFFDQFGQAIAA